MTSFETFDDSGHSALRWPHTEDMDPSVLHELVAAARSMPQWPDFIHELPRGARQYGDNELAALFLAYIHKLHGLEIEPEHF